MAGKERPSHNFSRVRKERNAFHSISGSRETCTFFLYSLLLHLDSTVLTCSVFQFVFLTRSPTDFACPGRDLVQTYKTGTSTKICLNTMACIALSTWVPNCVISPPSKQSISPTQRGRPSTTAKLFSIYAHRLMMVTAVSESSGQYLCSST